MIKFLWARKADVSRLERAVRWGETGKAELDLRNRIPFGEPVTDWVCVELKVKE